MIGSTNKYLLKSLAPQTLFKFCYCLKLLRYNIPIAKLCSVYTEIKLQNEFSGCMHAVYKYFPLTFNCRVKSNVTCKTFINLQSSSELKVDYIIVYLPYFSTDVCDFM